MMGDTAISRSASGWSRSRLIHRPELVMGRRSLCAKEFVECSFNANIGHTLPPHWAMDTWAFFSSFR
jgi:hypothetical protein